MYNFQISLRLKKKKLIDIHIITMHDKAKECIYIDNLHYKIIRNENIFEIFQIVVLNVFRNVNITI